MPINIKVLLIWEGNGSPELHIPKQGEIFELGNIGAVFYFRN
jgi:hypothetical protein